jgi:hypothetical protein
MIPGMALELPGPGEGLLDDGVLVRARGAGPDARLVWRARLRDDEGRVWRAEARSAEELFAAWAPAKRRRARWPPQSLRPVRVDVRVETPEGRTPRAPSRHCSPDRACGCAAGATG